MYLSNDKMDSILKNVNNISKIHGLRFIAAQFEYLLYQIYIANAATVDQLSEVINLEKSKLRTSLSHTVAKGLLESINTMYNGESINVYSLTAKGIEYINGYFDFCDYEIKQRSFNKQINHFIESGSLYFSVFNDSKGVKLLREESHFIDDKMVLRPDAELFIEYDEFKEHFFIENDRGTELEERLTEKLNEKYGIYMLNDNPVNLVITVSRESLLKNKRAKDISKELPIRMAAEYVKILRSTAVVMSKLELENIDELYSCIERYYSVEPDYKTHAIINEHIDKLMSFKKINETLSLTTKEEIYSRLYYEDDVRKKTLDHAKTTFLKKNTDYRVDTIKKIISKMSDSYEINEIFYKSNSKYMLSHITFEESKMLLPSYRKLLLSNEIIIGTLFDVKWYFSKRTRMFLDTRTYFEGVFNLKFDIVEHHEIEFMVGELLIKKRLNSCVATVNGRKIALTILEPHINFSDKLKLELIKDQVIQHNFDNLKIIVLDKKRLKGSDLIEYEDFIVERLNF